MNFILKTQKSLFEPLFRNLMGNLRTPSITRWKVVGYQNIRNALFGFVAMHACDGQTDGQNYDSQDRVSIAASRGKNRWAE